MHIAHKFPNAPLLGVGFSLGANVLTRYLGEEGEQSRVHSGCMLACVRVLSPHCLFAVIKGACVALGSRSKQLGVSSYGANFAKRSVNVISDF